METMDSPDAPEILAGDWFDVFEPEFRIDPYRYYRRLRQEAPVHWGTSYEPSIPGMWHCCLGAPRSLPRTSINQLP
jgi:hypothetical protein